ncbi:MAG TPA: efflux RND transporter periplasmic adaptor subunit [Candidatus Acidoferrum sp.]|nr:efflux RND transporter periplasmic adaptor subunit [Candidatus Acidoferrum sp.]
MKIARRFKRETAKRGTLLASMLAVFLAAAGCGQKQNEKEPVVSVQTTPAQRAAISQIVSVDAVVFPLEQATIAPKITSTVKKFFVQRGTRVKKGQLMAELENADLSASAESSKGDYEQAEANYAMTVGAGLPQQIQKAELDAAAARSAFEAQQKIYASRKELLQQGAIPRRDVDAAEVALAQARSQSEQTQKQLADLQRLGKEQLLKSAQGSKESAKGKYLGAAAQLSYSLIKSPIDGVVTDRPLYEGDLATANQPILTVMNLSRLIAKAHIPQVEAAQLRVGNPAEIKVAGLDEPMKARVSLVSPALDPGSTTIEVWVEAGKPDPALRPGMTVPISMTAKTAKDAIVVPVGAVYRSEEVGDYVLVAGSDEKAHQTKVQIGIRNGDLAQVVSGINEGDPVITSGGYAVPDGTKVKIEKPDEKESAAKGGTAEDKKSAVDQGDGKGTKKATKASEAAKPASKGKE